MTSEGGDLWTRIRSICVCVKKKNRNRVAHCSISRHLVRVVRIRFFSFLALPSFRSLSQIENRNRDVSVYQCWLLFIGFVWWAVSSTSRSVNFLERIISSVIAYYCVYVRVCVCICSCVDVVLCQSINFLLSIPYLLFIIIIIIIITSNVVRKKKFHHHHSLGASLI